MKRRWRAEANAFSAFASALHRRFIATLLPWAYERLYHELAWAYDPISWLVSSGQWRAWQRAALPYLSAGTVLEIGCGPGHLLLDLLRANRSAFGVDVSPAQCAAARGRLARSGYPNRVAQTDGRQLPLADASFDGVVLTFPTPVIHDPALWREIARVLRPRGQVVVVLGVRPNRIPWWNPIARLWRALASPANASGGTPARSRVATAPLDSRVFQVDLAAGTILVLVAGKSGAEPV
jgi:SAM-dependent methyltransferase